MVSNFMNSCDLAKGGKGGKSWPNKGGWGINSEGHLVFKPIILHGCMSAQPDMGDMGDIGHLSI